MESRAKIRSAAMKENIRRVTFGMKKDLNTRTVVIRRMSKYKQHSNESQRFEFR